MCGCGPAADYAIPCALAYCAVFYGHFVISVIKYGDVTVFAVGVVAVVTRCSAVGAAIFYHAVTEGAG